MSSNSGLRSCLGYGSAFSSSSRTCPGLEPKTTMRPARNTASSTLCVTTTSVFTPVAGSRHRSTTWLRRFSAVSGSSAPNGSSISRISGATARARANPTRCFIPPDSSLGYACSKPSRPTRLMARATASRRAGPSTPRASSPIATFSATVSQGRSANDWNTIAAAASTPSSGCPRYSTAPSTGRARPANSRSSVLLPHPDGPTSATTSCSHTLRETSRSASSTWPLGSRNRWVTCRASSSSVPEVMRRARSELAPIASTTATRGDSTPPRSGS